ncbi:ATP-binding protein [Hamadaea sp. NPDC050747]|uniref:ATP-binding protein n=1 Tax=Hamadaea sp. NPDC050747 TaxID=3155789 RepID=UPI0033F52B81
MSLAVTRLATPGSMAHDNAAVAHEAADDGGGGHVGDADRRMAQGRSVPDAVERPFATGQLHEIRDFAAAFAVDHGATVRQIDAFLLVASELVVNAVRHGGGTGLIRLWHDDSSLWCQVADHGPGLADMRWADNATGPIGRGGRGLWIVRTVAETLTIQSGEAGTTATARIQAG